MVRSKPNDKRNEEKKGSGQDKVAKKPAGGPAGPGEVFQEITDEMRRTSSGVEIAPWCRSLLYLRKQAGVGQEQLAGACKNHIDGIGRDRTYISKLEHGRVKAPPTRAELYYMLCELKVPRDGPDAAGLAQQCYGQAEVQSVMERWKNWDLAEDFFHEAEFFGLPRVKELCDEAAALGPDAQKNGILILMIFQELAQEPASRDRIARLLQVLRGSQR